MKFKTITYHKVFNLGNYSNEKIGCEIELEENDNPVLAHKKAVEFVERANTFIKEGQNYNRAKEILKDENSFTGKQIKQAMQFVEDFEKNYADLIEVYKGVPVLTPHPDFN